MPPRTPTAASPGSLRRRPTCEPLEARALLAAGIFGPVQSHLIEPLPADFARVNQAVFTAWEQISRESLVPVPPPPIALELVRPSEGDCEILELLAPTPEDSFGPAPVPRQLTLGYVAEHVLVNDLDGDGEADVFVTNEQAPHRPALATMLLGPLGAAPPALSMVARDVTGDEVIDLVVTSSVTERTWLLRGLGEGRFDDQLPRVLPVGPRPLASFVEDFDGDGRFDLLTMDSGNDGLTFYSDFVEAMDRRVLSSGGRGPIAALARDVNGDSVRDVIVAHREDSQVSLFLGGAQGPTLRETVAVPGGQPTALVGSASPRRFYVAYEEGGGWVDFTLAEPPETKTTLDKLDDPAPTLGSGPARMEGRLQSLSQAFLDLVPTVVATLEDEEAGPAEGGGPQAVEEDPRQPLPAEAPPPPTGTVGREEEEEEVVEEVALGEDEKGGLQRFLLGVDETPAPALETTRDTMPIPTLPEQASDGREPPVVCEEPGGSRPPLAECELERPSVEEARPSLAHRDAVMLVLASQFGLGAGLLWHRRRRGRR